MKGRVIAIDSYRGRTVAALVEDGQLLELAVDAEGEAPLPGAIFRAVVNRPMKGQGGVFVSLPGGQSGYLRQVSGLAPGQRVLVQVAGHAEPGKAVPVTLRLLFKSRYAIVTPGAPGLNISRRIRDEATRARLTALAETAMAGAETAGAEAALGLVLRSAAAMAQEADVTEDIAQMRGLAEAVLADLDGAPELLVDGAGAEETAWRDWADPPVDEFRARPGALAELGVDDLIDAVLAPRVALPGGGHMMVEPTRALVAVDVNTGNDTSPAAGLKANIAAARDLPRQLRLRGLGGQVVVDFAPMSKKDRATLDQVLRAAFKAAGTEVSLAGWTPLGNFELQRKRDRIPLSEALA
ncbi:ribonuclease G [Defluviimonas sp. 20V17]|uniref:Ribonuclease G n=1 Tax=Allgaiera indica TaxID=765699 RepID=A0AAN4UUF8_9RHOB|nr:ribonuclease E/G [Allgaiera indica]KDB04804.1 ribonuclease G [Defluviimonas sp. 20V17]GHE05071.1 ribonuclease G [Allgaiera indica]SDX67121.1 ribonuclease, Rne/Rng family [Allgaiera indica]